MDPIIVEYLEENVDQLTRIARQRYEFYKRYDNKKLHRANLKYTLKIRSQYKRSLKRYRREWELIDQLISTYDKWEVKRPEKCRGCKEHCIDKMQIAGCNVILK